jgi:hypothetical protein
MKNKKRNNNKLPYQWYRPYGKPSNKECEVIDGGPKWETDNEHHERQIRGIVKRRHCSRKKAQQILDEENRLPHVSSNESAIDETSGWIAWLNMLEG